MRRGTGNSAPMTAVVPAGGTALDSSCAAHLAGVGIAASGMQAPRQTLASKLCATLDQSRGLRMDGGKIPSISATDLYASLGSAAAPIIIDVRPETAAHALAGAARR